MVVNSLKAFLFTAAGATAAVTTAYVSGALDPYLGTGEAAVISQSEPASPKAERLNQQQAAVEPAANPQPEAAESAKPTVPEAPKQAAPSAAPAAPIVVAPSFDVVRAEPDGSIVVAGKAAPQAMVEIVAGARVLGKTKAGAAGDFAIVLDEPLRPGGHELVLRSTAEDNVVATSPETAVISIPEQTDGQVLALVEKPGEPSKLITVPKPEPVTSKPATQPQATPTVQDTKSADASNATAATPPTSGQPAAVPGEPTAAKQDAGAGQSVAVEQPVPAPGPKVTVDAVEIEGRKVFVAGAADPGRNVRVYANDILLGEAPASPSGRFLIETERDLPVGDYIIRADALEPDGDKVVARAAVPFEREPGSAVAAVAPEASSTTKADASPKPAPGTTAESGKAPEASKPVESSVAAAPSVTVETPASATAGQDGVTMPAGEPKPAPDATVATAAPEASAPKLENVNGAVIIRRGDTLWKISRRVYGRGVRYSTIYLANQEQISDPDRIWPGQVFNVPEKTSEGEPADMSAVKDQATKPPPKAAQ